MSKNNNKSKLAIDTNGGLGVFPHDNNNESPTPALAPSSTSSTLATANAPPPLPETPRNQPISTRMTHSETIEEKAKVYVAKKFEDLKWDELNVDAKNRVMRMMTDDQGYSPSKKGTGARDEYKSKDSTTYEAEWEAFCKSLPAADSPSFLYYLAMAMMFAVVAAAILLLLGVAFPTISANNHFTNTEIGGFLFLLGLVPFVYLVSTAYGAPLEKSQITRKVLEGWSLLFCHKKAIKDYLVIRQQKSGICVLHAGVTFQHYLQSLQHSKNGKTCDHKMLDISEFLREQLEVSKRMEYIVNGECGLSSLGFFLSITGLKEGNMTHIRIPRKSEDKESFDSAVNHLLFMFKRPQTGTRAPALVSKFNVEEGFINNDILDGEVDENKFSGDERHSMVLIGAHRDKRSGKVWILLQNFWLGKYFRLVSAEYLACCEPTICFLVNASADVSLKGNHSIVDAEYVENNIQVAECRQEPPAMEHYEC